MYQRHAGVCPSRAQQHPQDHPAIGSNSNHPPFAAARGRVIRRMRQNGVRVKPRSSALEHVMNLDVKRLRLIGPLVLHANVHQFGRLRLDPKTAARGDPVYRRAVHAVIAGAQHFMAAELKRGDGGARFDDGGGNDAVGERHRLPGIGQRHAGADRATPGRFAPAGTAKTPSITLASKKQGRLFIACRAAKVPKLNHAGGRVAPQTR